MTTRPISVVADTANRIRAGQITQLRRPGPLLAEIRAGDRLWLREQFHLSDRFDRFAPSAALRMGATVNAYSTGVRLPPDPDRGRRRFAREMPRGFSRMHLVVLDARRERLQDITDADLAREGAPDREAFAAAWDAVLAGGRTISGSASRWADNPRVTVITFTAIMEPLQCR